MDSHFRFESGLPSYVSVCENVAKLKRELSDKLNIFIRNAIGGREGQSYVQIYLKFKLVLMDVDFSLRPK